MKQTIILFEIKMKIFDPIWQAGKDP